ncbi:MAG: mannitol dehydrogenase [Clostridia bacterium]|nr:mannitol dehydrogenase [Clostridia bacterium]
MKKAVMYGGGNIGRGFIAQLFYKSGYETVFIDVNDALVDSLNSTHEYPVYVTGESDYIREDVKNVRAVNGKDADAVANEIASCDVMATAVGANILKFIAEPVAKGIQKRMKDAGKPLNIIICENLIDADKYFRSLIDEKICDCAKEYFAKDVGLIEASIGRMVPGVPEEIKAKEPLAVCVEPYCMLPIDENAIVGEMPEMINLEPSSPFEFFIRRKLYMHNMSHAVTAYLGYLRGYEYIWQAIADEEIKAAAKSALYATSKAMAKEFGKNEDDLKAFSDDLLVRFTNKLLGDTVARVGRDTVRKLDPSDRLCGTLSLITSHGIECDALIRAIAAALKFDPEGKEPIKAFCDENGVKATLEKYCRITDNVLVAKIEEEYNK